jgi:hypothetical protein
MGDLRRALRLTVVAVALTMLGAVAVPVGASASGPGVRPYVPGADGHRPGHPSGITPNRAGDPAGSHFGNYDPSSFGWTWAPGSIPFSYHGHVFPQGVVNADVATIFTKILDTITPGMREPLCYNHDCWGYEVRTIGGGSTRSFHGYGLAIDVNAVTNGQTSQPMSFATTTLPLNTGALIRKYGAEWGGDWSADSPRDPMHMELQLSPAGAAQEAAAIRAGTPPTGPRFARFGTTVPLTGNAAPNAAVKVWLHRRGKTGYLPQTVQAGADGSWRTHFLAADDYRYYATTGGATSPGGLTQIEPYTGGPAKAARGSTVAVTGTGRPQTTLTVWFHRRDGVGYTSRGSVTVSGVGHWSTSYAANDDYRYYTVDNTTGRVSDTVLTQLGP